MKDLGEYRATNPLPTNEPIRMCVEKLVQIVQCQLMVTMLIDQIGLVLYNRMWADSESTYKLSNAHVLLQFCRRKMNDNGTRTFYIQYICLHISNDIKCAQSRRNHGWWLRIAQREVEWERDRETKTQKCSRRTENKMNETNCRTFGM